jgi:conjugal transfer pilin signal peptidase TrbI
VPPNDRDHTKLRRTPRLLLCAGLGLAVLGLSASSSFAARHALLINASPSLPFWALWLDREARPKRGDLLVFVPPRSELLTRHFGIKKHLFGKRVLGLAGDQVSAQGRMFLINGKPIARAKPHSRLNERLAPGPTGTIPHGCYFVGTEHPDSFDSRYAAIGWICQPRVLGVGTPIL